MGASKLLMLLCALACVAAAAAVPSLDSIDSSLSLLETQEFAEPAASSVLAEAQAYAKKQVAAAVTAGQTLLAKAATEGAAEGSKISRAAAQATAAANVVAAKAAAEVAAAAAAKVAKASKAAAKLAAATKFAAEQTASKARAAKQANQARLVALRRSLNFRSAGLKPDSAGVFGGVHLGPSKADEVPSTGALVPKGTRTALNNFDLYEKKDFYGQQASCLKDIAAHFDEQDIFESKKNSLLQQLDVTRNIDVATKLRTKLTSLETWHQMMQKKFLASANEAKEHAKKMERLFDAHLPQKLKDQLAANKVAKRAAQKIPFPAAHKQAVAFMKTKRTQIASTDRMRALGHKLKVRPTITNREFPSMDLISSHLREKQWRQVHTEESLSTDARELEKAENIVTAAHKAHGDFQEGPIAEPLLRGKLYHPETEPLGVPNFFGSKVAFPWPLEEERMVDINDKVKVEQTEHQTW